MRRLSVCVYNRKLSAGSVGLKYKNAPSMSLPLPMEIPPIFVPINMFKKESQKKDKQFRFPFRRHKKESTSTIHVPRRGGDTTVTPLTPPPPQPKKPAIDIPPNELWDRAYDDLKEAESSSKLIEAYEAILSLELSSEVVDENGNKKGGSRKDGSQKGQTERQVQMNTLLDNGLKKTAKLSKVESGLGDAINIVLSLKDALDLGLKAVPVAAAAWSGICVALQVSSDPDLLIT